MEVRRPPARTRVLFEGRLLGGCSLVYNGRPISEAAFSRRRAFFLLLHLLLTPTHRITRDQTLDLLWPDSDPAAAAAGLRMVLSDLRAACAVDGARPPVLREAGQVVLDPAVDARLDVAAFEQAANAGLRDGGLDALRAALDLYGGPLLPNLPYEDWVERPRRRLADLHERLLTALVARETTADPRAAETHLRALLELDPAHEERAVELMCLLDRHGQRAEARRVYDDLAAALRADLDADPSAETEAAYLALRGQPPATAPVRASRLPAPVTSFVGRARELAALTDLLSAGGSGSRLLTLTGAGGSGKTRLALAVAGAVCEQYPGGIWLLELAAVHDPRFVPRAAAAALEVREEHGQPIERALAAALQGQPALLVLDNCEHLVAACADLAAALLAACPTLHILATSRERLNTAGELAWRVPSLPLPPAPNRGTSMPATLAELARAEAVVLFVDRARLALPAFALTERNAPTVARICTRLDGIPLAIELAAARLSVLPLEGIAARLDDRFRLLTGGSRTALPRQQTLRAALDWSYALLTAQERTLLSRLAMFTGGWTLEAAEGICVSSQDSLLTTGALLEPLAGLVNKSLVFLDDPAQAGEQRYHMLETVREYARERLVTGDEAHALIERYQAWYVALSERLAPELVGAQRQHGLGLLDEESDNLRALLSWTIVRTGPIIPNNGPADPSMALRLVVALWRYWDVRGYWSEGRRWVTLALALPGTVSPGLRAAGLNAAGALAANQGDIKEAESLWEQALALKRLDGDQQSIASGLNNLSIAVQRQGNYARSAALLEESLTIKRAIGDRENLPYSLNNLGIAVQHLGDLERAASLYQEAAAGWSDLGDDLNSAYARLNLAVVLVHLKQPTAASVIYEETLAVFRQLDEHWGIAAALHNLGNLAIAAGEYASAEDLYRQSQQLWQHLADKQGLAESLESWASLAHARAWHVREVRLYAAANIFREAIGSPAPPADRAAHERQLAAAREALGDEEYATAWSTGQSLTLDEALVFALAAPSAG